MRIKRFNQERGFTLVEVLVVLGIVGVISAALMTVMQNQLKQANHFEFLGKKEQLRMILLGQFLNHNNNCRCLFNGASSFPAAGTDELRGFSPPTSLDLRHPTTCAKVSKLIDRDGEDGLKLNSVKLKNMSPLGAGQYSGEFSIDIESTKSVMGPSVMSLKVPVVVRTNPVGTGTTVAFNGCSVKNDSFDLAAVLATTESVERSECLWNNDDNTVVQACPPGRALIACSGGPGDQDESQEAFWIVPDYNANSCTLHVRMPRCNGPSRPGTYQKVIASCYLLP